MKALVLGAGGFIGGELHKALKKDERFTEVVGQSRKYKPGLNMRSPCYILYQRGDFDVIFNCIGRAHPGADPVDIWEDNTYELMKILMYCSNEEKPPLFIHLSSIVVDNYPLTLYAASKAAGELLIQSFTETGGIRGVILRPCSVNGGNSTHGLLHDIIKKLKENQNELEILSTYPGAFKPFIYVNDLVDLMIDLVVNPLDGFQYSVSSKNVLSVDETIDIIMKTVNINAKKKWVGEKWLDQPKVIPITDFLLRSAEEVVEISTREIWQKINSYEEKGEMK